MNCRRKNKIKINYVERGNEYRVYSKSKLTLRKRKLKCSGGKSCSCSTTDHRRVTLVTGPMVSHIMPFSIVDFNMVSTVIIIMTLVVAVYGHECKDFKLSASNQSVIDMMKHYIHTSRRTECSNNKLSNILKVD